jgi:hypothetical protein
MKASIKKVIALLFTLTIIMSSVSTISFASQDDPRLELDSVNYTVLDAGEEYQLILTVENISNYTALYTDYQISVPDDSPIVITDLLSARYHDVLSSDATVDLSFKIAVDYDAVEGSYPVYLTGTYYNIYGESYELDETFNLYINESDEVDNIEISLVSDNEAIAGEDFTTSIAVENTGDTITDVVVSLVNLSSTTIETTATDIVDFDFVASGESVTADFDLYAYENLESGVYEVEIEVSYEDADGREQVETGSIYIKVETDEEEAADTLIIESVTNSKETIDEDESFVTTVKLTNEGEEAIEDIVLSISQDENIIPVTQSIILVNSIGAYESQEFTFKMKSTDSATTGNYPLEITVEYNDGEEVLTQYTGIYVENDDEEEDEETTTPRIIIDSFTTGLDKIFVGDEFDLDFILLNTSSIKDIYNLKVIISTDEGSSSTTAILPINQSNSEYVGTLLTGETHEISIPFKVIANADGAIYSLTIEFEYEDEDGELYTDSETINIPVYQEPLIEVSDVSIGTELDSAYTLEVDFYNTGKVDITNMMVDIEGDFVTTNSNYYVGDFATGRMDVYDVEITGSVPDIIEGTIIFTYDDTFGEEVEYLKEFYLETGNTGGGTMEMKGDLSEEELQEAMASGEMGGRSQQMGMVPGETEDTSSNMTLFIAIGAAVVVMVVVIVIIVKKRKKKNELN